MTILVTIPRGEVRDSFIPDDCRVQLEKLGRVVWNESDRQMTAEELKEALPGVSVCLTGWGTPCMTEDVLTGADALRVIAHKGGSVAGYVSEAVYDRGLAVISGNELYARSVAESVIAYALASLRNIIGFNRELLETGWSRPGWRNEGLLDQTVGLIGFGAVARHTARMLSAFGVKLFVNADHVSEQEAALYGAQKAGLDEILARCKVISIHLARTPETFHLIDEKKLALIPDGALLINTARGSIIDEAALSRELARRRFRAVLDVYETEPLPGDRPLRKLDNVILMPHMGGPTMDRRPVVTRALIGALDDALAGRKTELDITREMMRRMTR